MAALMVNREFDKRTLGPVVLDYLARKMDKAMAVRRRASNARFIDIQFEDFIARPVATAEKIYAHFRMPMTGETAKRMRDYAASHPMGKHGKHEYRLTEYGLSADRILSRFDAYIREYQPKMD